MRKPNRRFWYASLMLVAGVAISWLVFLRGRMEAGKPSLIVARDGSFSFSLPAGFPRPEGNLSSESLFGTIDLTSESSRGSFVVRKMRVADGVWASRTKAQMLDEARDNMLRLPEASLEREAAFEYHGHSAKSFRLRTTLPSETQFTRMDYILASPVLYILSFSSTDPRELEEPAVAQFFRSLELSPSVAFDQ